MQSVEGALVSSAPVAGSLCARHPTMRATATCARCGDFVCGACVGARTPTGTYCNLCAKTDFEARRKEHIQHEASVRSIGSLYYLACAIYGAAGLGAAASMMAEEPAVAVGMVLLIGLLAFGFGALGRGVRRLQRGARTVATVLSAIGLLGFPMGTLINGYILYLLHSKKGVVVFSDDYKMVIAATPHVVYRTPRSLLIALGVLVLLIAIGIAAALMQ